MKVINDIMTMINNDKLGCLIIRRTNNIKRYIKAKNAHLLIWWRQISKIEIIAYFTMEILFFIY